MHVYIYIYKQEQDKVQKQQQPRPFFLKGRNIQSFKKTSVEGEKKKKFRAGLFSEQENHHLEDTTPEKKPIYVFHVRLRRQHCTDFAPQ